MTLENFRTIQRKRQTLTKRNLSFAVISLAVVLALVVSYSSKPAAANEDSRRFDQQLGQGRVQDMMIMDQNTAVWTSQGLVVLQGNRLLHYSADMELQQAINLPLANIQDPQIKAMSDNSSTGVAWNEASTMRSRLAAQIIPAGDGLIVVRGQQVIWLDGKFSISGQATLPDLPMLSAAELAAICPIAAGDGMQMGGQDMMNTASNGMGQQDSVR